MTAPVIPARPKPDDDIDRRRTYAAVVILEVIVVAALWAFSRYFSA